MTHTVYALVDPRDPDTFRYIGVTNNPARRLKEHQQKARLLEVTAWRDALKAEGVVIEMRPLAVRVPLALARDIEWHAIGEHRARGGCDLNIPTPAPAHLADAFTAFVPCENFQRFDARMSRFRV